MYSDGMGNTHVKNATTNAAVTFACQDILRQLQSKCDIHPHPPIQFALSTQGHWRGSTTPSSVSSRVGIARYLCQCMLTCAKLFTPRIACLRLDAKGDGQLVVINGLDTLDTLPLHVINGAGYVYSTEAHL